MRNYWMARTDSPFAEWEIIFPPPDTIQDVRHLLDFTQRLLQIGEEESVYRVIKTRHLLNFDRYQNWNYIQFLEERLAKTEILPLFDLDLGFLENNEGAILTPARICYYNLNGNLTESEVDNIGLLLKTLRPDDADWGSIFMEEVSPVMLLSRQVSLKELSEVNRKKRSVQIQISLCTDIWFPKVLGILEGDRTLSSNSPKWYENSELANCHTVRLNQFISKVHQLTVKLNGEWRLNPPEGIAEHYASMTCIDGIIL